MITCWEKADILAMLYVIVYCVFVTFPYDVLGQVLYLIVSIPDLCLLSLFRISALGELISVNIFKKSYLPCLLRQRYNQFKIKTYLNYEYTTLSK